MKLQDGQALRVSLRWSEAERLPVGRLAWRDRRAYFEYSTEMLASGLLLSPFELPLRRGVLEAPLTPFNGLFGVFADSLPDGWGLLLQDRRATRAGLSPASLTPLDRLAQVGDTGLGALTYQPELGPGEDEVALLDLDVMAANASQILQGEASDVLPTLMRLGGSPQGERPKVLIRLRPEDGHVVASPAVPSPGHRSVLVKFHARADASDAGAVEMAYHQLAREAGIDVPDAWLLPSSLGSGWFTVERFDVHGTKRRHVHTLCGLLHADHRLPSLDYADALIAVHRVTRDTRALAQMLRRMVFNVVMHNRDDHTKQTTLCMDRKGEWTLSPAYDLTWSEGPGGEHSMAVAGKGHPSLDDLLAVAERCDVAPTIARQVIDEVVEVARSLWVEQATAFGVSAVSTRRVKTWIERW